VAFKLGLKRSIKVYQEESWNSVTLPWVLRQVLIPQKLQCFHEMGMQYYLLLNALVSTE
jgi:hypothetical protein